jgi:hypothetical protein
LNSRFFDDILKTCPSSIDSVTVEPDGTWRSSDDRYGTAPPKAAATNGQTSTIIKEEAKDPSRAGSINEHENSTNDKGKGRAGPSLTIDSDDDSPMISRVKKGAPISIGSSPTSSHGHGNGTGNGNTNGKSKRSDVIDLTLSSDDEEEERETASERYERELRAEYELAELARVGERNLIASRRYPAVAQEDEGDQPVYQPPPLQGQSQDGGEVPSENGNGQKRSLDNVDRTEAGDEGGQADLRDESNKRMREHNDGLAADHFS